MGIRPYLRSEHIKRRGHAQKARKEGWTNMWVTVDEGDFFFGGDETVWNGSGLELKGGF